MAELALFSARWIAAPESAFAPWFRGEIELPAGPVESARLAVHSPANYELHINGKKIGDDVLSPPVSDTRDRTFVITYDVADVLRPGKNCIGVWASKGWAERLVLRAQLEAVIGGKCITFATGPGWKTHASGISHIGGWQWGDFGGEGIDARLHLEDWARPGLDTSAWTDVLEAPAPKGKAERCPGPLNRIGETIAARAITPLGEGRYEIDFGTNLTGWLRLAFRNLRRGQVIRLHFADRVFRDGATPIHNGSCAQFARADGGTNLYQTFNQVSEFISAGSSEEEFRHRFNYAGFRYVIVEGLDAAPRVEDATAFLVESDLPGAGTFECSDPLLNRIHAVNHWTMRCLTLGGYYVDCPHRERMGYGDGQVALQGMMMNFDASAFYAKWVDDWRLAFRRDETKLPYTAPPFVETGGGPAWPGNIVLIPWWHYLHYGDPAIITDNLAAARAYCEYLDAKSTGDVLRSWGEGFSFIGDWVPPGRGMDTENWPSREMAEFFSNCYRVYLWSLLEKVFAATGRADEATPARRRADAIRTATHAAFYDPVARRYVADEQIYYAFPLLTGVAPESERAVLHANLLHCLNKKNRGHPDTGMLGTLFLIEYLSTTGRDDLILGLYQKTDYPGWGYMLAQGATTFWEQWNGYWSQIHSCFTSADNWLYHRLAGIRPDPDHPGFKNVIIQPAIVGDITWAKATHHGPYGLITSQWHREGDQVVLEATIPPNSTATIRLPGQPPVQAAAGFHRFVARLQSPPATDLPIPEHSISTSGTRSTTSGRRCR